MRHFPEGIMAQQGCQTGRCYRSVLLIGLVFLTIFTWGCGRADTVSAMPATEGETIKLPEPVFDSGVSLEQSLRERRSVRDYSGQPLTLGELSQLLWAAQGITSPAGARTAPSAGALYPLEVYVVVGDVRELSPGVYHYIPEGHELSQTLDGDRRDDLAHAALGQDWVAEAAAVFLLAAVYERTTDKYGDRGIRYVHLEAGHAAQNLCLEAVALGLGAVTVGAFDDGQVASIVGLPEDEKPLYIIPAGRAKA